MRFGGDRQVQEPRGVVLLRLRKLPTGDQLLGRELMDGLEHGKAGVGRRISIRSTPGGESDWYRGARRGRRRPGAADRSRSRHRLRRIEGPAAGKHRQSSEEGLLRRIEEIVTPGDRSPQRLLSLRAVPATSGEEREAAVETRQDRLRRQESHARRRQLDGEREAIQATTDGDDRFRVVFGQLEVALHRAGTIDEEADRLRGQRIVEPQRACRRDGSSRGGIGSSYSPEMWSGARLVTRTWMSGQWDRRSATSGDASTTCSKLSSTRSKRLGRR